jgi:hypothetical protein
MPRKSGRLGGVAGSVVKYVNSLYDDTDFTLGSKLVSNLATYWTTTS